MPIKKIPFYKFSSCGNNFLIIDETQKQYLTEDEKSQFSIQATNTNFGVGADGVIFLQPFRPATLENINFVRNYWKTHRIHSDAEMIFRLFEPNGVESFSCGNGLMCVAQYLNLRSSVLSKRILTQVPTVRPKAITIGTDPALTISWANMGRPHRVPAGVAHLPNSVRLGRDIDMVNDLTITFRQHDLHPFSNKNSMKLKGYLVYTGEPHLVIFVETDLSIALPIQLIFGSSLPPDASQEKCERRTAFGSWLIHHIGAFLNKHYRTTFPQGINVDFVNMPRQDAVVEYRCFERGINQETLACGTGALAVAFVARKLDLLLKNTITVWPHRCRWYDRNASIYVESEKSGWSIKARPALLSKGDFYFKENLIADPFNENRSSENTECQTRGSRQLSFEYLSEC
jgi:diaminopimelate epimerase